MINQKQVVAELYMIGGKFPRTTTYLDGVFNNHLFLSDKLMWCQAKLSNPQLNYKSTQPQPNVTKVGSHLKMALHTHPPPTKTHCQQYLSCLLMT